MAFIFNFLLLSLLPASISSFPQEPGYGSIEQDLVLHLKEGKEDFTVNFMTDYNRVFISPMVIQRNLTDVEIERVSEFSKKKPQMKVSSQEMRVFKERPDSFPFSQFKFRVEVLKAMPLEEVFKVVLKTFANVTIFGDMWIKSSSQSETNALLQAVIEEKIQVRSANILPGVDEDLLLRFIQSAKVKEVIGDAASSLSNAFFQNSAVRNMEKINFKSVEKNDVSDETLAGLNASEVSLGNTSRITEQGVGRFLQAKIDKKTENYAHFSLKLKRARKMDVKKILDNIKTKGTTAWKKKDNEEVWTQETVRGNNAEVVMTLSHEEQASDHVETFTLFIRNSFV